ncbi:hypothetical protein RDWZM_007521 [Blomia tropicalis]|uniref:Enolase-phosphatase E1 n=1 Tax=Blomia tropicalis TaxID=40697 RepID=A0A9Q0LZX6_BLOTA|nr:hypothetical protein RDWZM_007521 [Blomia tropicalis]
MGPLKIKKPKVLLFDLSGTVTKASFIDGVLFPYIRTNISTYFTENWDTDLVKTDVDNMRKMSKLKPDTPKIGEGLSREKEIKAIGDFVKYCMEKNFDCRELSILRFNIWFDGYKRGRLETPVYSDVAVQLKKWQTELSIKLFVMSNGWSEATKRFLAKTNHGDLNILIENHFDPRLGDLTKKETFVKALQSINQKPDEALFLTKDGAEGNAAKQAGLNVILVLTHRRNITKLEPAHQKLPRVRSFNEIDFTGSKVEKSKKNQLNLLVVLELVRQQSVPMPNRSSQNRHRTLKNEYRIQKK